jgi:hypothetical protein
VSGDREREDTSGRRRSCAAAPAGPDRGDSVVALALVRVGRLRATAFVALQSSGRGGSDDCCWAEARARPRRFWWWPASRSRRPAGQASGRGSRRPGAAARPERRRLPGWRDGVQTRVLHRQPRRAWPRCTRAADGDLLRRAAASRLYGSRWRAGRFAPGGAASHGSGRVIALTTEQRRWRSDGWLLHFVRSDSQPRRRRGCRSRSQCESPAPGARQTQRRLVVRRAGARARGTRRRRALRPLGPPAGIAYAVDGEAARGGRHRSLPPPI